MSRQSLPLRLFVSTLIVGLLIGCAPAATSAPTSLATVEATNAPATEQAGTSEPTTQPTAEAPQTNLTDSCAPSDTTGVDYFPEKTTLDYAQGFTVEYHDTFKVVTVTNPWPDANQTFQYVLVQCGTTAPTDYPDAAVIEIPVKRMVVMSTSYLTQLDDMGLLDRLVGLDAFAYTSNPRVREMIDAGKLVEIAPSGTEVDVEKALDLQPDVIMTYSSGVTQYDLHPAMIEAGLPVVINGDWMESTPISRAEWIKFMALFFNTEGQADDLFNQTITRYQDAATLAANVSKRPTVMSDTPYEGTWYLPGGQSFTAQLIKDAGGDYIWGDDSTTGTLSLDFESVFEKAQDADFWINVFGYKNLSDLTAADERLGNFNAFKTAQVYANDAHGTGFGTELYETGVEHPDAVLIDLVKIFHPDLLPDHELYYYRQMK